MTGQVLTDVTTEATSKLRSSKALANRHNPAREVMTTLKFSNEGLGNMRDHELESELQCAMDSGHRVWVVGDIHGYLETFEALVDKLDLSEGDHVLCLGDLIDRGPGSRGVLEMVSNHPRMHSIRGNHEESMRLSLCPKHKGKMMKSWLKYGGVETLQSFSDDPDEQIEIAREWLPFVESLPTELILNGHRIVHAGYDLSPVWKGRILIDKTLEDQTNQDRMWSRTIFTATSPPDPERQVIVGHTTVQALSRDIDGFWISELEKMILDCGIWASDILLEDGRPSVLGIDTGVYLSAEEEPRLTAFELLSGEVISQSRIN